MVYVDVKHHVYLLTYALALLSFRQSRGENLFFSLFFSFLFPQDLSVAKYLETVAHRKFDVLRPNNSYRINLSTAAAAGSLG